jgi:hypothetical protein
MPINQLTTANTFSQWLTATQALIQTANTLTDGNLTGTVFSANTLLEITGAGSRINVRTSGSINVFHSNTSTIGNVISTNVTTGNVNVTNQIIFSDSSTLNSSIPITRSFAHANAGFVHANSSFGSANTIGSYANSSFSTANLAFTQANTPSYTANSAASYANSAFIRANTPTHVANSAASYANSAFLNSNSSFIRANAGFIQANAAFIRANNSLDANNGGTITGSVTISTGASGTSLTATANINAPLFVGTATQARYADLAEKYLADADYSVGTLLIVGGEKEVTQSESGVRPIGVVSANPAYMMNSELEGGTYVALKGRVPIRVFGYVTKGFPLIASHISGVAKQGTWSDNYFAIALNTSESFTENVIEGVII